MPLAYETINALTGDKALVKKNNALSCGCCYGCEDLRLSLDAMFAGAVAAGVGTSANFTPTVIVSNQQGFTEALTLNLNLAASNSDYFAILSGGAIGERFSVDVTAYFPRSYIQERSRSFVGQQYSQDYFSKYILSVTVRDTQFVENAPCLVSVPGRQGFMTGTIPSGTRVELRFIDFVENYIVNIFGRRQFIGQVLAGPFRLVRVLPQFYSIPINNQGTNEIAAETNCNYSNGNGIDISPDTDWYRDRILVENFYDLDFRNPVVDASEYGRGANIKFGTEIAPAGMFTRDAQAFRDNPFRYPDDYPIQWTTPTIDSTRLCLDHSVSYTNHLMPDSCNTDHTITGLDDFFLNFLP